MHAAPQLPPGERERRQNGPGAGDETGGQHQPGAAGSSAADASAAERIRILEVQAQKADEEKAALRYACQKNLTKEHYVTQKRPTTDSLSVCLSLSLPPPPPLFPSLPPPPPLSTSTFLYLRAELRRREEAAAAERAAAARAAAERDEAERAAREAAAAAEREVAEQARQAAVRAEAEREKLNKLFLSIAIDMLGMATYAVPVVGEAGDVGWAPISAFLIYKLYGNGIISGIALAGVCVCV